MKFSDLLRMSGSNLLRRKLRTALTVLGVVIGTASIVVMISLGLGLQKSSLEQIEQYGGLTTINVNTWGNYNSDSSQEELRIDDGVVETISKIPHVEFASPILSTYVLLKQGVYEGSLTVQGMTQEALQNMDMKVGEGTLPEAGAPLSFFYGNQVMPIISRRMVEVEETAVRLQLLRRNTLFLLAECWLEGLMNIVKTAIVFMLILMH